MCGGYPSDMAVALAALDALVHVQGANNVKRTIAMQDFHRLPGIIRKDNNLSRRFVTTIELHKRSC